MRAASHKVILHIEPWDGSTCPSWICRITGKQKKTCNVFSCSCPPNIVGWRVSALRSKWKSLGPERLIHLFVSHSCAGSVWTPSSKNNSFRLAVFHSWVPLSAPLSSGRTSGGCIACGTIRKDVTTYYLQHQKSTFQTAGRTPFTSETRVCFQNHLLVMFDTVQPISFLFQYWVKVRVVSAILSRYFVQIHLMLLVNLNP